MGSRSSIDIPVRAAGFRRRHLVLRTGETPRHIGVAVRIALFALGEIHRLHLIERRRTLSGRTAFDVDTEVALVGRHYVVFPHVQSNERLTAIFPRVALEYGHV